MHLCVYHASEIQPRLCLMPLVKQSNPCEASKHPQEHRGLHTVSLKTKRGYENACHLDHVSCGERVRNGFGPVALLLDEARDTIRCSDPDEKGR